MRYPPESVTASWPTPNYVDPVRRGPTLLIIESVLIGFATFAMAARFYARSREARGVGLDDVLIVIAYILAACLTAAVILATQNYGWDVHIWDLPPQDAVSSRLVSWISQVIYLSSASATKLSLLFVYRQLFARNKYQRAVDVMIGFVIIYYLTFIFVLIFECRPTDYYWHYLLGSYHGTCINEGIQMTTSGIANVVIDILILALPMRVLFLIKASLAEKVQLAIVFSAGIFVVVASSFRVYYDAYTTLRTYDVSWYGYVAWTWTAAEVDVGIICACLPVCRHLFASPARRLTGAASNGRNKHTESDEPAVAYHYEYEQSYNEKHASAPSVESVDSENLRKAGETGLIPLPRQQSRVYRGRAAGFGKDQDLYRGRPSARKDPTLSTAMRIEKEIEICVQTEQRDMTDAGNPFDHGYGSEQNFSIVNPGYGYGYQQDDYYGHKSYGHGAAALPVNGQWVGEAESSERSLRHKHSAADSMPDCIV
jgi:hypothetical protein